MDSADYFRPQRTAPSVFGSSVSTMRDVGGDDTATVPGPAARFGRSLAVVIGINTYGEGLSQLRSAVPDARAVAETLQRDHAFETWCFLDEDAQLSQLLAVLHEKLPSTLGPEDRLLFYFAGHGIALDSDAGPAGFLIPARARRSDLDGFLPMRVVHAALTKLPVRHALVILDCCFAGTFRWAHMRHVIWAGEEAKIYRERYDRYIESPAWQVLTSASSDQRAFDVLANDRDEGAGVHSPFARALLAGLAGAADYTKDNIITVDELAIYVRELVAPATESVGARQVPQLFALERHDAGQFVFQVPNRPLALAPAPALDESANPYRGLEAFREQDHALFFGREELIAELVAAVHTRRLTVAVGPSGSGKSSLVQAGLVPMLRAKGWMVLPMQRPGREPLAALDAWTLALGASSLPDDPVAAWATAVAEHARARPDQPWLVIVDQLEELLTHRTAERDRLAFLGALESALQVAPNLHLVVTVRSDAEPQFHDTALSQRWTDGRFPMRAMTRDELRQMIERPASVAVLHFQPSRLIECLLDDVALVPAPLPLLSFALSELYRCCWSRWSRGVRDRALHESDYVAMGSVARVLTQRATTVHDQLVAEDAAYAVTIRNLFTRMVSVVGGEVARRRVPRSELTYGDPAENQRIAEVLQQFHHARLISLGRNERDDSATSAYAEPTHDELVRGWTKVGQWLDEFDASLGLRALASLGDAVRSWNDHGQRDSYLWNDPRLGLVHEREREQPFLLNANESRFVRRSAQRQRRRRARVIAGLLSAIVVLAILAGAALWQRQRASNEAKRATENEQRATNEAKRATENEQRATSEAKRATKNEQRATNEAKRATENEQYATSEGKRATESANRASHLLGQSYAEAGRQLLVDGHYQEAVPYLLAARQNGDDSKPLQMMFRTATRYLPLVPALEHQDVVKSAAFSPDGSRVITASEDNTARVWDAATGKLLASFEHQTSVVSAAFSPDGTRLVTASADTVQVWDAATGEPLASLEPWILVVSAAFSPDGTRMVTASDDKTARVWDAATGKPITGPLKHQDKVVSAAFSPDSTRVVTASCDSTAWIWDAATGKPITGPLKHQAQVVSAAFSPDGTRVVTASEDKTARVWDAATGKPITGPLEHQDKVVSAAFSPDGTRVVTASDDTTARVWDGATGKPITGPLEHQMQVVSAAFSPDGTRVVTASWDNTARVWDAATGKPITSPLEHQDMVVSAAFSPDGTRVVTASWDKTARVWDAATGKPPSPLGAQDMVVSAAFSSDGTRLLTASGDTARVWDAATGKPITYPLEHQAQVERAAFSPDGTRVFTVSKDNWARVWDAATGKPITSSFMPQGKVVSATFSPGGTRVVTASWDTARVWDAATGKAITSALEHQDNVASAAFSPDDTRVVTASADKTARVWDAATGKPITGRLEHQARVVSAAFSSDGTRVVTASADKTARVWDAATGKAITGRLEHQAWVESAAFSPDGTRVLTASGDTARVWDAATGKPITGPLEHQARVESAAFSPDGTRVLTASGDTAWVWDAATGKPITGPLEHQARVVSAAFSPDGTRVLTASVNSTARVWDAATGKPIPNPLEHQARIVSAAFSPDGIRVVTASEDKTARVWDVATGKPITGPLEHQDKVVSAVFSPDGTRVVTASKDKTARVWNAVTGKPITGFLEHQDVVKIAVFSPDGTRVVTASDDYTAWVWNAATGKPITGPLERQARVVSAAFSPDGTRVVTVNDDYTARVWNAATGKLITGLEPQVVSAAFSLDGTRLVTASKDKTARVWDAATGKPITNPLAHQDMVVSAAFSPDGTRVVTASGDTARVWDAATGKPLTGPLEHQDMVVSAAFSPDGTRVLTASRDNTARVWDARLDKGTLEQWSTVAKRSPFVLSGIALVPRAPPRPEPGPAD